MTDFTNIGWQEKLDALELAVDPPLMPLVIAIREDMELFAAAAQKFAEMSGLALKQRQQILDAQAVFEEMNL